jgi:isopropylmalate/homocitrate/citramalate synthase
LANHKICISPYNFEPEVEKVIKLPEKITIYDSTLRDGEQMPGVSFTPDQKLKIARKLDEINVPQIEAGFPVVSDEEQKTVKMIANEGLKAEILALTRLKKEEVDIAVDCDIDMILLFIASSDIHLKYKLKKWNCEEIVDCIYSVIDHANSHGLKVSFSTEDSTRTAFATLQDFSQAAIKAGIERLGLTDTVGCINPQGLRFLVSKIREFTEVPVSIHLHNDFGLALTNALAGIEAGAEAVATTVNGIGERAGNVPLEQLVVALKVLYDHDLGIDTTGLKELSEMVTKFSGIPISPNRPLVGDNVFSHESGIHIAAILNHPVTYECIPPELVGGTRKLLMGKHTGTAYVSNRLKEKELEASPKELETIVQEIKVLGEYKGRVTEDEFWNIVDMVLKK